MRGWLSLCEAFFQDSLKLFRRDTTRRNQLGRLAAAQPLQAGETYGSWKVICRDIGAQTGIGRAAIPMANGGVLHG